MDIEENQKPLVFKIALEKIENPAQKHAFQALWLLEDLFDRRAKQHGKAGAHRAGQEDLARVMAMFISGCPVYPDKNPSGWSAFPNDSIQSNLKFLSRHFSGAIICQTRPRIRDSQKAEFALYAQKVDKVLQVLAR